nr:putative uncharacterized protein YHR217C [Penaeus vannamei]
MLVSPEVLSKKKTWFVTENFESCIHNHASPHSIYKHNSHTQPTTPTPNFKTTHPQSRPQHTHTHLPTRDPSQTHNSPHNHDTHPHPQLPPNFNNHDTRTPTHKHTPIPKPTTPPNHDTRHSHTTLPTPNSHKPRPYTTHPRLPRPQRSPRSTHNP